MAVMTILIIPIIHTMVTEEMGEVFPAAKTTIVLAVVQLPEAKVVRTIIMMLAVQVMVTEAMAVSQSDQVVMLTEEVSH